MGGFTVVAREGWWVVHSGGQGGMMGGSQWWPALRDEHPSPEGCRLRGEPPHTPVNQRQSKGRCLVLVAGVHMRLSLDAVSSEICWSHALSQI